jgi:hypothetical protein
MVCVGSLFDLELRKVQCPSDKTNCKMPKGRERGKKKSTINKYFSEK